ncbi:MULTISPECIES: Lrp/AsnC family transcriptional regulator [Cupriavidus]|jgi:DNA-binding Lrp family transcriptional regulator|uniref:Lrp/AsnC family transcriptional regulator n=1 Tax=Cupriavidus basilensis TaxID=68895 RepID=A0A643G1Z3_9BURK|nr:MULTISPECIES: Lrp/AsnC family transcriptional regulator [Cupriavidus]KUE87949.1 AsnC family transcriptional regulator [Cupriavidus necator]NOV23717.1 Lrp/AsnC family transcriptional regulator [Cupriavidus necator]QOT81772.1 Lrp/AsnC family transcriptional regulator [Cupriavidus basilensis]BDB30376.1 Lrp/AsnC family transcriptional regulator [Cupriavidus sp. P-10]
MPVLDTIDRRILAALQRDGRISNNDLALEVGLSPSPCLRRLRMLEDTGVIRRYTAVLAPSEVGLPHTFFARISLRAQDGDTTQQFAAAMSELPQVLECYLMFGDCDALLRVVASDLEDYRRFLAQHLTPANGVRRVQTEIPCTVVKQTLELPLHWHGAPSGEGGRQP